MAIGSDDGTIKKYIPDFLEWSKNNGYSGITEERNVADVSDERFEVIVNSEQKQLGDANVAN